MSRKLHGRGEHRLQAVSTVWDALASVRITFLAFRPSPRRCRSLSAAAQAATVCQLQEPPSSWKSTLTASHRRTVLWVPSFHRPSELNLCCCTVGDFLFIADQCSHHYRWSHLFTPSLANGRLDLTNKTPVNACTQVSVWTCASISRVRA